MRIRTSIVSFAFASSVALGCNSGAPGSVSISNTHGAADMSTGTAGPTGPGNPGGPINPGGGSGGTGGGGSGGTGGGGGSHDMATTTIYGDGGPQGHLGDGGVFMPPPAGADMAPVYHPPVTNGSFTSYATGVAFNDVSVDEGGGIWGASDNKVYYIKNGSAHTYDQSNGLAQGKTTWVDNYWCAGDGLPCPYTWNVSFQSVAGGQPGQAVVGNIGFIADRLDVDPNTGAVRDVVGLQVTSTQQGDPTELMAQQQRIVASWKVVLDLNGTFNGTAYMGGWHGTSAFHGFGNSATTGICGQGCAGFEEHIHAFSSDGDDTFGGDVHALAITAAGDVWVGDRKAIYMIPQRSKGADADFFQSPLTEVPGESAGYLITFPGAAADQQWNWSIAIDQAGGLWVASNQNGLVYLTAGNYSPTYYSTANGLPSDSLTGVAVDASGDVWVATTNGGVARFTPSTKTWLYYTTTSGLPSNNLRAVWYDKYGSPGAVYFATDNGLAVYK